MPARSLSSANAPLRFGAKTGPWRDAPGPVSETLATRTVSVNTTCYVFVCCPPVRTGEAALWIGRVI